MNTMLRRFSMGRNHVGRHDSRFGLHRSRFSRLLRVIILATLITSSTYAGDLPDGYWDKSQVRAILDKTLTLRLAPDLTDLSANERIAVTKLLEVGRVFQRIYEDTRHHEALDSRAALVELHEGRGQSARTGDLLTLYRLFQGPIAIDLDNERRPFLPVAQFAPERNIYPIGVEKAQLDSHLAKYPTEKESILHLRGIVRRTGASQINSDLQTLDNFPVLDTLHPGLRARLDALERNPKSREFYGVPYSVAFPGAIMKSVGLLNDAADAVSSEDELLARYLRLRARDLLADDYDGGDAAWIRSDFNNLNVQIGSYETYDDKLYGVKSFFGLSVLVRDEMSSTALREAIRGIQAIENSLPYAAHKKIQEGIPVGIYSVIADFGQTRGTNTATILPNESHLTRLHGRTILLRENIIRHPDMTKLGISIFEAAVHPAQHADYDPEGRLHRILWHEIGHYLGPDRTSRDQEIGDSLEEHTDLVEELKADLVSLFSVSALLKAAYYDEDAAKAVYASGILRVIQNNKPLPDQPYRMMQLMQWNHFLREGVVTYDPKSESLRINYGRYPDAVRSMLKKVLSIQYDGDKDAAERLIQELTTWDENVHGVIAQKIRAAQSYRYYLVYYGALGE